jgi:hypothetical protein
VKKNHFSFIRPAGSFSPDWSATTEAASAHTASRFVNLPVVQLPAFQLPLGLIKRQSACSTSRSGIAPRTLVLTLSSLLGLRKTGDFSSSLSRIRCRLQLPRIVRSRLRPAFLQR